MTTFTPILHAPQVAANQNQKEATINTAMAVFEAACNDHQTISLATGNHTYTTDEFTKAFHTIFSGHTVARTVTLPNTPRWFAISNTGTANITVICFGSAGLTVVIGAGKRVLLVSDGTDVVSITQGDQVKAHAFFDVGVPTAGKRLYRHSFIQQQTFAADFGGSQGHADESATVNTSLDVLKNGTLVGTINFAAGAHAATFSTGGVGVTFAIGDILTIDASNYVDATLGDINATLMATLS